MPTRESPGSYAPRHACDCHLHVYGPATLYPLVAERNYDPRSTIRHWTIICKAHRTLGLERAVIVTGSANGTNNQISLDALARMRGNFKALALLDPAVSDNDLLRMKDCGFTGFRVKATGKGGLSFNDSRVMSARVHGFDWHVEFMSQSMTEVIGAVPFLNSLKLPYVFDHVAHAEPQQTRQDREFSELLTSPQKRRTRLDQSLQFLSTVKGRPAALPDMIDVVQTIIEARPDHVIWGSNWPHAGIVVPMPDDGRPARFPPHRRAGGKYP